MYIAATFDAACAAARAKGKWLMVSIVDVTNFVSQTMNRDLFKDRIVQEAIVAHFVFVQWTLDSPNGAQHRSFYPFETCPYTAIVDPVTGERARVWDTAVQPRVFEADLEVFIETHGVDPLHGPLVSNADGDSDGHNQQPVRKKKHLTEDEELALAIRESLRNTGSDVIVVEDDDNVIDDNDDDNDEVVEKDGVAGIVAAMNVEPGPGEESVRIQIRSPDGERQVRKFRPTDTVRVVFAYARAAFASCATTPTFDLLLFRDRLSERLDSSVDEAHLGGASLTLALP